MDCFAPAPEEPQRAVAPEVFLERVRAAAELCGVTRLADITRLDRIGLPVWQAVRPSGRSLSVHQGKGSSVVAAKISALCEAIETHCAEHAPADGPLCHFHSLPPSQRALELGDYCRLRDTLPPAEQPIQWCSASDLATGGPVWLPHHVVSLDYRSGLPSLFERVSGGLGAGSDEAAAVQAGLLEAIERDAEGEWRRLGEAERADASIDLASVGYPWFEEWRERLAALEVDIEVFELPSIVGMPVPMCIIGALEEFGGGYRRFSGTAAHPDPEMALFKALAEAIQSRLTIVAGVRDDILPGYYDRHARARRPADGIRAGTRPWAAVAPYDGGIEALAEDMASLGFSQLAVKRLGAGLGGVAVVKVFVPGLGSLTRTRRRAP